MGRMKIASALLLLHPTPVNRAAASIIRKQSDANAPWFASEDEPAPAPKAKPQKPRTDPSAVIARSLRAELHRIAGERWPGREIDVVPSKQRWLVMVDGIKVFEGSPPPGKYKILLFDESSKMARSLVKYHVEKIDRAVSRMEGRRR